MDARRFRTNRSLTLGTLKSLGGRYDGVVERVSSGLEWNEYKGRDEVKLTIHCVDGMRMILSDHVIDALVEFYGTSETDRWEGQRLIVIVGAGRRGQPERKVLNPYEEAKRNRATEERVRRGILGDVEKMIAPVDSQTQRVKVGRHDDE